MYIMRRAWETRTGPRELEGRCRSAMRRKVLLGLLLLAVSLLAACSGPTVEPAPSVSSYVGGTGLVLGKQGYDFGAVPFNREVRAAFVLRNVGDRPLSLGELAIKTVEGC